MPKLYKRSEPFEIKGHRLIFQWEKEPGGNWEDDIKDEELMVKNDAEEPPQACCIATMKSTVNGMCSICGTTWQKVDYQIIQKVIKVGR